MKQLLEILKIFLEKHFMPAVSAIAIALISIVLIPEQCFIIERLGFNWFLLLQFCLALLMVEAIIKVVFFLKRLYVKKEHEKIQIQQKELERRKKVEFEEAQIKKSLDDLWTFVDGLDLQDKKYVDKFLKTENTPIRKKDDYTISCSKLLSSKAVHKTLVKEGIDDSFHFEPEEYQYILNDDIYQLLKFSQEKYGKISHFG